MTSTGLCRTNLNSILPSSASFCSFHTALSVSKSLSKEKLVMWPWKFQMSQQTAKRYFEAKQIPIMGAILPLTVAIESLWLSLSTASSVTSLNWPCSDVWEPYAGLGKPALSALDWVCHDGFSSHQKHKDCFVLNARSCWLREEVIRAQIWGRWKEDVWV